ncbi:MAG: PQQ-dependent sugar dehydrogenase [Beijerinckiaceae bacterium]|jgi:glucose/arabinose dehydrogenase
MLKKRHRGVVALAGGLVLLLGAAAAVVAALLANGVKPVEIPQTGGFRPEIERTLTGVTLPPGFHIGLFAMVPGARDLAVSADGAKVFVGTNGQDVFVIGVGPRHTAASVKRFAPGIAMVMPHGVCFAPDKTLYVVEQNRILAFPDAAAKAESPGLAARIVVPRGQLIPVSEEASAHSARVCRIGPDGKLYVTIGQPYNVPPPEKQALYEKAGLGAILRMDRDGSHREIFASGIRNSVGLDFNPKDGTLWFTDNQVDRMGDDIPPGELNRATKPGQNFGFPWYGGGHVRTSLYAKATPPADVVFPEIEMVAHAADLGMTFYRGTMFPEKYRGGIFSAQHGSWNRSVPIGARVMFSTLKPDGTGGEAVPFAEGWRQPDGSYAGRPVDVAELPDGSLLVSDDQSGAVYRIWYGE